MIIVTLLFLTVLLHRLKKDYSLPSLNKDGDNSRKNNTMSVDCECTEKKNAQMEMIALVSEASLNVASKIVSWDCMYTIGSCWNFYVV